ncbi:MAG: Ig-like domain-containing protein [Balneolales bacterium]
MIPFIFGSCATPSQPTGGPSDDTGPEINATIPESGTVNFKEDRIIFDFSDFVERNSFMSAFRMEPDVGIDFNLNWGRTSVQVEFEQGLPDTTTMIFTVGTDLTDTRNNNMAGPYQLALSTGPDIDSGSIRATVFDAETGEPEEGGRVFLYRAPYDLTEKANYSVETDTAGVASFNYLREGTYRGLWVDDRNRNQIWEPPREAAQPFPTDTVQLDKDGSSSFGTVHITRTDTISPELSAVGLLSSSRMRLRFSEDVNLDENAAINIFAADGEPYSDAIPLYTDQTEPNILFAQSIENFEEDEEYKLEIQGIADAAGNMAYSEIDSFIGSGEPDTTLLSYREHITASGIYADEPLIFQYSKIIDEDVVVDSLKVVESETLHEEWPRVDIVYNELHVLPDTLWDRGASYEIRVWDPAQFGYENIEPVIWHEGDLGEMELIIEESKSDTALHLYSLYDDANSLIREGSFQDSVNVDRLPPQDYKLIVYEDKDESGTWDPGHADPYRAPEPYFIQRDIPVQDNMTGQVYINFSEEEYTSERDSTMEAPDGE